MLWSSVGGVMWRSWGRVPAAEDEDPTTVDKGREGMVGR